MSRLPNYLPRMIQLARQLQLRPGSLQHCLVWHDPWCAFYRVGVCDCDPDVALVTSPPVGPGGHDPAGQPDLLARQPRRRRWGGKAR